MRLKSSLIVGPIRPVSAVLVGTLLMMMVGTPVASAMQIEPCVVGTWRPADLEGMFRAVLADTPQMVINSVTGGTTVAIRAPGSYELRYDQMTVNATLLGESSSVTFEGFARGSLRSSQPGVLTGSTTESSITLTLTSDTLTISDTMSLPEDEGESMEYDCGLGRLTFFVSMPGSDGPPTKIPISFVRAN